MEELLKRAHEGNLTMFEVYSLFSNNRISQEDAEVLAGILMDC